MPARSLVPVIFIDRHGKETLYKSVKDAAESVGVLPCRISTACVTGNRCAGRYWKNAQEG